MITFLIISLSVIIFLLLFLLCCFCLTFYSPKKRPLGPDEFDFPKGKIYEPYYEAMRAWTVSTRNMDHKDFSIKSFDGLTLKGKYYEFSPDAPIELMLHGYRGTGERDLCGAVERCFALGRSAFIVDQRGCGLSEGRTISFGINEKRDCLAWVDKIIEHFGDEVKIILTGISMGASTVIMASEEKLPKNVISILADCGFSSAPKIIKKVIRQLHLPTFIFYPAIRLSGMIFGGFDIESSLPIESIKKCNLPIIFFHGEDDDFVPVEMCKELYDACKSEKEMVIMKNAGHGLAFPSDEEGYLTAVRKFEAKSGFLN